MQVHAGGFPEVLEQTLITSNNTNGASNFDSSRAVFDPLVVREYIDNTGARGGALVTSYNETNRSDLRLYASDGNKTMLDLYAQGDGFQDTCVTLLERMLNTVPSSVQLQPAITPALIKPVNVTWDVTSENQMVLSGRIRVSARCNSGNRRDKLLRSSQLLYPGEVSSDPVSITFSNGYTEMLVPEDGLGTSAFRLADSQANATARYLSFSIQSTNLLEASSFTIATNGFEPQVCQIQDEGFVIPSMTNLDNGKVSVTVATRIGNIDFDASQLAVEIGAPVAQPLTLVPKIIRTVVNLGEVESPVSNLRYWSGSAVIEAPTGAVSVGLLYKGDVIDILLLDAAVAGW